MQQRHMEPDRVRSMANTMEDVSAILRIVSTVLEAQIRILEMTAFIGNIGGAVIARYLDRIQPAIEKLSKDMAKLAEDANKSAADWERATQAGN
jgi:hypothetical protein